MLKILRTFLIATLALYQPSLAQMPGGGGQVNVNWPPPEVVFIGSSISTANASSYNFGNFNVGTEPGVVVVTIGVGRDTNSGQTISGISIGGSAGTVAFTTTSAIVFSNMGYRATSGTSVNVTVTTTATVQRMGISVYMVRYVQSTTPVVSVALTGGTSNNCSMANAPPDKTALILSGINNTTSAWTPGLWTEDVDAIMEGGSNSVWSGTYTTITARVNVPGPTFTTSGIRQCHTLGFQ